MPNYILRLLKYAACLLTALILGAGISACTNNIPAKQSAINPQQDFWNNYGKTLTFSENYTKSANVKAEIKWMQKHPYYFYQLIKNARPYIYYVNQQTVAHGLPPEIALMPMIESAYDPFRYSSAGATGLWDLMPGTASGLGVRINWWFDGRRAVVESTNAALRYITDLHKKFNDWGLAISAYDSGSGLILKAMQHNKQHHLSTNLDNLNLPIETKAYLPKIMAIAVIIHHPEKYGFSIPPLSDQPQFDSFTIKKQMDLKTIAHMAGTSLKVIRNLNPGFRRWATEPSVSYSCLIPRKNSSKFAQNLIFQPKPTTINWQRHKVASGDTLSGIAKKYHTSTNLIMQLNKLHPKQILHIGQVLLISADNMKNVKAPKYKKHYQQKTAIHSSVGEDVIPGPKQINYHARSGDSLYSIAHHFGVKIQQIIFWNQLSHHHKVRKNEHLVIWRHGNKTQHHQRIYYVKQGDSLYVIAHKNHLLLPELIKINPQLKHGKPLRLGQHIIVRS